MDNGEDEQTCNPEAPDELRPLLDAGRIGHTAFSQHALFATLMKLIETVENLSKENEEVADIDDALQDELCQLWDMSMNPEVVTFLLDYKVVKIFMGIIAKSRAPRATEISVGILGNMTCQPDGRLSVSSCDETRSLLLVLLETPDPPTLLELTRLLHTCVCSPDVSNDWALSISRDPQFFTNCTFILHSSTNVDLLRNLGLLLDLLVDLHEAVLEQWNEDELVSAVLEALKQAEPSTDFEDTRSFYHLLQLLTTRDDGVEALIVHEFELRKQLMSCLKHVTSDDVVHVPGREAALASVTSVLKTIMPFAKDKERLYIEEYQFTRCIMKLISPLEDLKSPGAKPAARLRHQSESQSLSPSRQNSNESRHSNTSEAVATSAESKETFANNKERENGESNNVSDGPLDRQQPENSNAAGDHARIVEILYEQVAALARIIVTELDAMSKRQRPSVHSRFLQSQDKDVSTSASEDTETSDTDDVSSSAASTPMRSSTDDVSSTPTKLTSQRQIPLSLEYINNCPRERLEPFFRALMHDVTETMQHNSEDEGGDLDDILRLLAVARHFEQDRLVRLIQEFM